MTGSVTFFKWLPAFCRSRAQRDVHHSLQESDGCALWKLINKVRERGGSPSEDSPHSKVGHLTVSEGPHQDTQGRQVIGRLSASETEMLLSVLDHRKNSSALPLAVA
eukprot:CAMPEP_0181419532 /NCGR_PEP_ID=MMETSP1110-20121109/12121_1 /TAXON_ID=174948 /ORGANISM="Symbiodinium sp., Strain CCMP421" /LENGTH=106 /DNA_ID=CAMNT_0023542549 /DNA_START=160 /DNA_END=480 /DNA_ORIENTATION=+